MNKSIIVENNFHQFCQRKVIIFISISIIILTSLFYHHKVKSHYQIDFSAYYAGAMAIELGESPYNHSTFEEDNQHFKHSAYVQFPIVANFFRPMTFFSYNTAKNIWFFIQIGLLFGILFFLTKNLNVAIVSLSIILIITPFLFYPLFLHWDQGQTDLLVLFGIAWSKYLWDRKKNFLGGLVLGIGCIFKFPVYFLFSVPFFAKNWRFIFGGAFGMALLASMTLSMDGFSINEQYLLEYLPYLAENGTLPPEIFIHKEMFVELYRDGNKRIIWQGYDYCVGSNFVATFGSLSHY